MTTHTINILLTSFPGLGLPSTLSLPVVASTPICELISQLSDRLPHVNNRLILTTTSNKEISNSSRNPVRSLLSSDQDTFLPLRLSVPLCGGKGGFGSQLRAAGGRMSSRRKRNQGENNGSNRNLDGRRLRTVTEAKALAEYLAVKPEMEKKEKEARRKRWEQVVDIAERREYEIRNGTKGKVDGQWLEDKDEANERTREAVVAAMKSGNYRDNLSRLSSSDSSARESGDANEGSEDGFMEGCSSKATTPPSPKNSAGVTSHTYFGFDEDDEFMSDDVEEDSEDEDGNENNAEEMLGNEVTAADPKNGNVVDKGKEKA